MTRFTRFQIQDPGTGGPEDAFIARKNDKMPNIGASENIVTAVRFLLLRRVFFVCASKGNLRPEPVRGGSTLNANM